MYYAILFGTALLFFGLLVLLDKKCKAKMNIVWKVFAIFLIVFFFVWYMLPGVRDMSTDNLFSGNFFRSFFKEDLNANNEIFTESDLKGILSVKAATVLAVLACWFVVAIHTIEVLVPFFKDKFPIAKRIEKFIAIPMIIFDVITIPLIVRAYAGHVELSAKAIMICIEMGLIFGKLVFSFIFEDHDLKIPKSELKEFLIAIPLVLISTIPFYFAQVIIGKPTLPETITSVLDFSTYHRIYLLMLIIYLVGLTVLLRNKKGEYARMVLLFMSFAAMINFSCQYDFRDFPHPWSWPLQICNTAMFILPIALATKSQKVFYFTFFVNILGAMLASFMPVYGEGVLFTGYRACEFWGNHIEACAMPLVAVLVGVFPRPTKKQFFYSMVGFAIYFIVILVVNTVLTAYWPIYYEANHGLKTYGDIGPHGEHGVVDFFFLNSNFVVKKIHQEWIMDRYFDFTIGKMTFRIYPLYQLIYFVTFMAMSVAMWFGYVFLFKGQDKLIYVNNSYKKIKFDELALCAKQGKKEVIECMSEASKDKLVISHFGKRYTDTSPFAVRDINFEAHGGEIIGFLGPNGAGKSTTIKAIVGIHLPTEGNIEVNGYDVVAQPVQSKAQLGFVPDHYALYENLTGREYLNYIADLYDVSQKDRDEFLDEFLESLQMKNAIDNKMQTYSHGMKQKIAIMASIIHNPKLWILDEPLTGLDPVSIYQVKQCLKKHAEKGNIVFFSSHLIDIVEKLCDRIIIISDHKVQDVANVHELLEKGVNLEQYYMEKTGLVSGDN